ncbi:MAG: hypothetical protein ACM34B_15535, partial [Nitrospira sp.]
AITCPLIIRLLSKPQLMEYLLYLTANRQKTNDQAGTSLYPKSWLGGRECSIPVSEKGLGGSAEVALAHLAHG